MSAGLLGAVHVRQLLPLAVAPVILACATTATTSPGAKDAPEFTSPAAAGDSVDAAGWARLFGTWRCVEVRDPGGVGSADAVDPKPWMGSTIDVRADWIGVPGCRCLGTQYAAKRSTAGRMWDAWFSAWPTAAKLAAGDPVTVVKVTCTTGRDMTAPSLLPGACDVADWATPFEEMLLLDDRSLMVLGSDWVYVFVRVQGGVPGIGPGRALVTTDGLEWHNLRAIQVAATEAERKGVKPDACRVRAYEDGESVVVLFTNPNPGWTARGCPPGPCHCFEVQMERSTLRVVRSNHTR